MKKCTICNEEKDLTEYYKGHGKCKKCFIKKVLEKDTDEKRIKRNKWRIDNDYNKKYYALNKEQEKLRKIENKESIKERNRKYYLANKEKFRLQKKLRKDYGNLKGDLSNIKTYEDFLDQLVKIFIECKRVLKSGKYMSIIVSDFRHKSKYYMFHSDLMNALEKIGIEPKGLKVLYQRHKSIFPYGYPYAYVPNIHNQFILILQKPKKNEK